MTILETMQSLLLPLGLYCFAQDGLSIAELTVYAEQLEELAQPISDFSKECSLATCENELLSCYEALCFGDDRSSLSVQTRRDALKTYLTQKRHKNEHRELDEIMKAYGVISQCEPFEEANVRANILEILWGDLDFLEYYSLFSPLLPLGKELYLNDER